MPSTASSPAEAMPGETTSADQLAHDRQQALEIVRSSPPMVLSLDEVQAELLVANKRFDEAMRQGDVVAAGKSVQWQIKACLAFFQALPSLHAHDGMVPLRALSFALEDYKNGWPGRLDALFGRGPASTGAPSVAAVNAARIFCVGRLREGGVVSEPEACRLVACRATRAGLPCTLGSVHQTCLKVKPGRRQARQLADFLALMQTAHPLPADWPQAGKADRVAWLDRVTVFEELAAGSKSRV